MLPCPQFNSVLLVEHHTVKWGGGMGGIWEEQQDEVVGYWKIINLMYRMEWYHHRHQHHHPVDCVVTSCGHNFQSEGTRRMDVGVGVGWAQRPTSKLSTPSFQTDLCGWGEDTQSNLSFAHAGGSTANSYTPMPLCCPPPTSCFCFCFSSSCLSFPFPFPFLPIPELLLPLGLSAPWFTAVWHLPRTWSSHRICFALIQKRSNY